MAFNQDNIGAILNPQAINPGLLKEICKFFAESILLAHTISPVGWVVYTKNGVIILTIRNVYTLSVSIKESASGTLRFMAMVANGMLTSDLKRQLNGLGCTFGGGFKNTGGSDSIILNTTNAEKSISAIQLYRPAHERYIRNVLRPGKQTNWPDLFNPAIVQFLREQTGIDIPNPTYPLPSGAVLPAIDPPSPPEVNDMNNLEKIDGYLKSQGFQFTETQIASFYTALQTKGFVILSGISGTGKTKLAQLFAQMLPSPTIEIITPPSGLISIVLQPSHFERHQFIIPQRYIEILGVLELNKRINVALIYGGETQPCWMKYYEFPSGKRYVMFFLQGEAQKWLDQDFGAGDTICLRPDFEGDQLHSFTVVPTQVEKIATETIPNTLFLSVRPDWRDSKSLLGYYNPLMKSYEWTPFLRFLVQAEFDYGHNEENASPWFVILDEMNLARVEYYFADLLSVLESGRGYDGWTNEALRFSFGEIEEGDAPHEEIPLPPNLYIIGTVNVDETTQSFSPKVLDRAFSLEFTDVDFTNYDPTPAPQAFKWTKADANDLSAQFTRLGVFAQIDKEIVGEFARIHFGLVGALQDLNTALQPYQMHFGYRVFDEIQAFLDNAQDNRLFGEFVDPANLGRAFDQAVLMKVLPKFHGSRGKLEKPLQAVLSWCAGVPINEEPVKNALEHLEQPIDENLWQFPATARRVLRMLQSLAATGFASSDKHTFMHREADPCRF